MISPHDKPIISSAYWTESRRLREAWGDFLAELQWDWFVTLTFSSPVHPERANKLFRRWINQLNKSLYGHRWSKRPPFGVTWVMAVERHKSGEIHLHALILGVGDTRRLTWMDKWTGLDSRSTGWARIRAVENNEAVSRYVSKYVAKGGDIYFSDNFKAPATDPLALCSR